MVCGRENFQKAQSHWGRNREGGLARVGLGGGDCVSEETGRCMDALDEDGSILTRMAQFKAKHLLSWELLRSDGYSLVAVSSPKRMRPLR